MRTPSLPPVLEPRAVMPFLAALALYLVFLFTPGVLADADTYWHLAAGDWILAHRYVPHVDVFSYTKAGAPWQAHEWLSEVLMSLAFKAAGWRGVVLLYAAAAAAAAGLMAATVCRWSGGVTMAALVIFGLASTEHSLLTRPHILMLPLLVLWLRRMLIAREADRAPPLWLAVVMMVWANLHGSYVFGFMLAGFFGLEALWEAKDWPARLKVVREWAVFGVLCLLAAMITPHGPKGLTFPFYLMTMKTLNGIVEWLPLSFAKPSLFLAGLMLLLFVAFTRPVKIRPIRALLLLTLFYMALQHTRHLLVLAVSAPMILAEPLAAAMSQKGLRPVSRKVQTLTFIALAVALAGVRLAIPLERTDGATTPKAALAHVPPAMRAQPVVNDYDFGGFLIFNKVKVFIDGRADMYGDAFAGAYFNMARRGDRDALMKMIKDNKATWTIFKPRERMVAILDREPGWKRFYADPFAVIHVRAAPDEPATAPAKPAQ